MVIEGKSQVNLPSCIQEKKILTSLTGALIWALPGQGLLKNNNNKNNKTKQHPLDTQGNLHVTSLE